MPRTKKNTDAKTSKTKTVDVEKVMTETPAEDAKETVRSAPKRAGRKPAAKKDAAIVKAKKEATSATEPEEKKVGKLKLHSTASVTAKEKTAEETAETAVRGAKRKAKAEEKAAVPGKKTASGSGYGETIKVQFGGAEYDIEDIRKAVEADRKANVKGRVKTLEIYVKPEDHAVYYVVNSDGGHKVDL